MSVEDKLLEKLDRVKRFRRWKARIETLTTRRKNPVSEAQFCARHGIDKHSFNRMKNGYPGHDFVPSPEVFNKIEAALKKEGV